MATFNNILITSFDQIHTYDISPSKLRALLIDIQKWDIKFTEDTSEVTGKNGRQLTEITKNKKITVTGSNATNCNELFELTQGATIEDSATTSVRLPDIITVGSGLTVVTSQTAVGTAGAEIGEIRAMGAGNTLGETYEQAATADETHFSYDPTTKTITLPHATGETSSIFTEGSKIVASYCFETQGTTVKIQDGTFGLVQKVYLDVSGEDTCGVSRHIQFILPKAKFSGETGVSGGGDQSIQDFTIKALASGECGGASGDYFDYIVW